MPEQDEHVFLYYRSPAEIRREGFTHKMRGYDESEVREYLSLLADQVQATDFERGRLIADNERLRLENERLKAQVAARRDLDEFARNPLSAPLPRQSTAETPPVTVVAEPLPASGPNPAQVEAHAAAVLCHAQEVADQLVAEATRHAQRIIAAAQAEGRQVVRHARETAEEKLRAVLASLDDEVRVIEATRLAPPPRVVPAPVAPVPVVAPTAQRSRWD